ncbi:uncharacterized protein LOC130182798 [Seriola aureovittata]|uniref:uncharacterized protein LOC130182798 n=1 Tax=Seriola aureovittata TaxID=2871759 RepID=UPI0024BE693F|nr:uncharacterized protein LOC130182798 [Seriola aureovittata]
MTSLQGDDDTTSSGHNQMTSRKELQDDLRRYITETFNYINSVRGFCDKISEWVDKRKTESKKVVDIKDRADKLDLNLRHVYQSKKKGKALLEYGMSKVAGVNADKRRAELEKELVAVLSDTWKGLEELNHLLGAVEKLVVTSLHVFMENQVLHLPKGISLDVQVIIATARLICPLLIEFKRDSRVFSLPKLQNAVVLSNQLERYIKTTQIICDELEKRSVGNFCQTKPVVGIHVNLSKENMERMIHHVNELLRIRKDKDFQTVFIFPEGHCSHFITEFSKRQSKLQSLLTKLKDIAIRLDKVNKGIKIAYVAGSSVGAIGSVLSIVGLALSPLTLGASLPLTMAGLGMGIACGVSSAVTTSTKIGVNRKQQKKAACVFQSIKKDVESIQQCLEEVKMEKGGSSE